MVIAIDQLSDEPIYLQIRTQIVSAIARGELSRGDVLPSVRSLAGDLGINLHTVNKAYAVLRDEGYVVMRGRSGAVIADYGATASASRREEGLARISDALLRLALEFRAQGGDAQGFVTLATDVAETAFAFADEAPPAAGASPASGSPHAASTAGVTSSHKPSSTEGGAR